MHDWTPRNAWSWLRGMALIIAATGLAISGYARAESTAAASASDPWDRSQLVAWCIVPYDAKKRDSESRAAMLEGLGIRFFAYDWRAVHVPTFDQEVEACARRGIKIVAWWFPTKLDENARRILETVERQGIHPQLWVTGSGTIAKSAEEQAQTLSRELERLRPILIAARKVGCQVGLYNHGGWFGEPENQVLLVERLRAEGFSDAGLVYNFHHAHEHVARFAQVWPLLKPYVLAVNLNGMAAGEFNRGKKILPVGEGENEEAMMAVIGKSGWRGRVGILNHDETVDAEIGLEKNRAGFDRVVTRLRAQRGSGGKAEE